MSSRWQRLGKIFCPAGDSAWMMSHAANPVAIKLSNQTFRVFFNTRDSASRSYVAYLDLDPSFPDKVIAVSPEPLLGPGELGHFDDSGTSLGCLLQVNDQWLMYYVGWNLGVTVPFMNSIGLAISADLSKPFKKHSRAPIVDRSDDDPTNISYPFVLSEGGIYRMWYGSNIRSGAKTEDMQHVIKYAESEDGIHWTRGKHICIDVLDQDDIGACRPWVVKNDDGYEMWYSFRMKNSRYSIGYATSINGLDWIRKDSSHQFTSKAADWDSQAQCYASIFLHSGNQYMLYCGNDYGRTGFGLAIRVS